jgi:hypothetical protein
MPFTGILGEAGIAKESVLGTFVAPTKFLRFVPPFNFSTDINLLEGKGVEGIPDVVRKVAQGAALLKSGKFKTEMEPENIGEHLMAAFGTDTVTEVATFVVSNANNKIDFTENGGGQVTATLANATYAMGTSSAQAGTLCAQIKTQMQTAGVGTFTVTYSYSTKKLTITRSAGVFVIKWATGTNTATAAKTLLGFSNADTASAIAATSDLTTQQFALTHTFSRVQTSQLPSYSWWQKNGANYPEFAGCMLNKLEFDIKAKEFIMADADWIGLKYQSGGTSQSVAYSTHQPFKFDQAVINVGGSPVNNYDNVKLTIDNMVAAEHVVGNTIYATKIYSKGLKVSFSMSIIVEDLTEWTNFINGTSTTLTITITSSEAIVGTTFFSLTFTIPVIQYKAAPFPIPGDLVKIVFTGDAVYSVGSGYTIQPALVNTESSAGY